MALTVTPESTVIVPEFTLAPFFLIHVPFTAVPLILPGISAAVTVLSALVISPVAASK
ncbi:MAG: hypothetical protein LUC97_01080 [Clostridiales bacterium]|nr:hypothetical protein [Clostridiales bacterium]MCD8214232.1 hypothetical protein [Clostridiales bacterium]